MMKRVDVTKLDQVVLKDGKTVARCPACAARGGDAKGNNLVVFPDGRFGCAAHPSSKSHNRQILDLVGVTVADEKIRYHVPVRPVIHPPSTVIRTFGRVGRHVATTAELKDPKTEPPIDSK